MEQMTIPTYETCWNSVGVDGRKMIGVDFEANAQILKEFFYPRYRTAAAQNRAFPVR